MRGRRAHAGRRLSSTEAKRPSAVTSSGRWCQAGLAPGTYANQLHPEHPARHRHSVDDLARLPAAYDDPLRTDAGQRAQSRSPGTARCSW